MKPHQSDTVRMYRELLDAWNARDAARFAAMFAGDGSCVGFDGSAMNGREEIARELGTIFRDHQTARYVAIIREIRALDRATTLIRSVVGMVPPGRKEINPSTNAIQSVVFVEGEHHGTKVCLLQNTPAAFHGRPRAGEELTAELTNALGTGQTVTH